MAIVTITQSFRCARLCAFFDISLNSSKSWDTLCDTINQNDSQCAVSMRVDHTKRVATGRLGIEECTDTFLLRTETLINFNSSLFSTFRYTCMQENCDFDMLPKLFASGRDISELDTTFITQSVSEAIYNSTMDVRTINCTKSHSCSVPDVCQAMFEFDTISNNTSAKLKGEVSCIRPLKDDYLLNIRYNYWSNKTVTTDMVLRCNLDNCTNEELAKTIYIEIQTNQIIPSFNFSMLDIDKTCPPRKSTGHSSSVLSYGFVIFATISLLYTSR